MTERLSVFLRKPVEAFVSGTAPDAEGGELSRSIGLFQLTMSGVGATIGTAIFIVLTEAVPEAGPGVVVSDLFGFRIPGAIYAAPGEGGFFNLPAIVLVTLCGLLLIRGVRECC
jgi:hypothetical protein